MLHLKVHGSPWWRTAIMECPWIWIPLIPIFPKNAFFFTWHSPLARRNENGNQVPSEKLSKLSSKIYILNTSILWWHEKFFVLFFEINFTRYRDCVPMLSLMLFLDCSSDHWKYEKLLLCYCKPYGENSCSNFVNPIMLNDS